MNKNHSKTKPIVGVVGAGSFGITVAQLLAVNNRVLLYARDQGFAQSLNETRKWNDVKLADSIPRPGKFVLGVNYYLDIYDNNKLGWLKHFRPIGHIDHCYLLFEVKEEALKRIQ